MTAEHTHGPGPAPAPDASAGCPLCAALATVQGAQPEATEHLVAAGRELIGAFRAFLDAADAALDEQYPRPGGPPAAGSTASSAAEPGPAEPPVRRLRRIDLA